MLYIKTKIAIVIIVVTIVGIIVNSAGLAIPNAQSTSDEDNNAQTSDDGNNVLSFNQELLPDLSPSNQKIIGLDKTHQERLINPETFRIRLYKPN